jgi:Velvet factor
MSSLQDLRWESQEATCQKPGSWAEPVTPDAPKPRLPSFREILPAAHIESSPPEIVHSPSDLAATPLKTYYLPFRCPKGEASTMPFTMIKPENEAIHSTTRKTVHGKTLTYTLNVKQQPERARACGAGARGEFLRLSQSLRFSTDRNIACADRRPVDPPPVVELRVFEGESTKTDITLSYNANFFLFATLEVARPIANGRMHPSPAIPVLTGCPVAGANYLDRPSPAAYFLFPDLSVRHEGWYRLSFNLYEATKEAEDFDVDRPARNADLEVLTPRPAPKNQESMAWRLEVKSTPFQVYSAKKFPGLSESTEMSRIVADQGCRVRIRRDIRMRKRNTGKDEYEAYEEGMRSTDRYATPDSAYPPPTPTERQRSASRCSMDGSQFGADSYHRGSLQDSAYTSHGFHSATPSMNHSGSSFSIPPPPVSNSAPTGMPAPQHPSFPQAAPMQPPVSSSREFAVPLPPSRLMDRPSLEPGKPYYPQLPNPAAMPHNMAAEVSQPQPNPAMHLPALLTDGQPTRQSGTIYDPTRRQWNLPEPASAPKRSYSPRSDNTQQPLKQGMRPDNLTSINNLTTGTIEADSDPYNNNNNDDDDQYGLHSHGFMEYRRACGKSNRKRVPNLAL